MFEQNNVGVRLDSPITSHIQQMIAIHRSQPEDACICNYLEQLESFLQDIVTQLEEEGEYEGKRV